MNLSLKKVLKAALTVVLVWMAGVVSFTIFYHYFEALTLFDALVEGLTIATAMAILLGGMIAVAGIFYLIYSLFAKLVKKE